MTIARWGLGILVVVGAYGPWRATEAQVRQTVEAGVHYSTLDYDQAYSFWDTGWRFSFTGGAAVEIPLGERWALAPGLRYVQKGNQVRYDLRPALPAAGEFRILQDYLAVAVRLRFRPLSSRRMAVCIGPEVAFLVSAHSVTVSAIPAQFVTETSYDDIRDDLKKVDFSVAAGAEVPFPVENHEVFVALRYSEGLVGVAPEWASDWSTRGIESVVGLRW